MYDILKILSFQKCVKSTDFELCLKILSELNSLILTREREREFQQSIDLKKKDDKT